MIQPKPKKCKGSNKAKGFESCGNIKYIHRYGLCLHCFRDWLLTEQGQETLRKSIISGKKKVVKEEKQKFRKKKQEFNSSGMMRNADTYFSRYMRLKHSENGFCACYTCGNIYNIKEVDNGHYQKREHKTVRYDENNCRPQCKICNGDIKHNGKQIEFRSNLVIELGEEEVNRIDSLIKTSNNYGTSFYKKKSDYYRQKLNDLQKELGVKFW